MMSRKKSEKLFCASDEPTRRRHGNCFVIFLNNIVPPKHHLNQIESVQRIGKWVRRLIKIFSSQKAGEIEILHLIGKSLFLHPIARPSPRWGEIKWVDEEKASMWHLRDFDKSLRLKKCQSNHTKILLKSKLCIIILERRDKASENKFALNNSTKHKRLKRY